MLVEIVEVVIKMAELMMMVEDTVEILDAMMSWTLPKTIHNKLCHKKNKLLSHN